ncbi:ferritin-like domain-containing protein [Paenibacillus sp.]|jgi:rubrerythrin|uniref:ferritin-like domain-containing protein n=1 Tax=Paenibacillus sp. TaxID=58172 RepID=UPI00282D5E56|nr:ferritin-like domain-containing protein [Paenibacillus sp.]MDR0268338.1 ferritin-like domain-containing protein [Paenibacillus sp.]
MNYRTNGSGPIAVHDLQHVIQAEYRSMIYAQRLLGLAPPEHRMHFSRYVEIKQKERLVVWTRLYYHLTACYPVFNKVEPPKDYAAGLRASMTDALDAADLYAGLLDAAQDPPLQHILERAVNGETRWAVRLQQLYSSHLYENGNMEMSKGLIGVVKKQLPPGY